MYDLHQSLRHTQLLRMEMKGIIAAVGGRNVTTRTRTVWKRRKSVSVRARKCGARQRRKQKRKGALKKQSV